MDVFNKVMDYLGLYRKDAFLISFLGLIVGAILGGSLTSEIILLAFLISSISVNFIYSYNSYTDWEIDKINKPYRVIPQGKLSPQSALNYSILIFILSLTYPLLLKKSLLTTLLLFLFPFFGVIYSYPTIRFKKYPILALLIIDLIYHIPFIIGYYEVSKMFIHPMFFVTFFFGLGVLLLKDVGDEEGDLRYGVDNWFSIFGNNIIWVSIFFLLISIIMLLRFDLSLYVATFTFLMIGGSIIILLYTRIHRDLYSVYSSIIKWIIINGVLFILLKIVL
jgi:4-hydroxybenzoate polyprenyltransferase